MRALDESVAREVADWFLCAPSISSDPVVARAYAALEAECDRAFVALTDTRRRSCTRVVFTDCREPYASDLELIEAVRRTRVLEIVTSAVDRDRPHPSLATDRGGAYDRFRAVHDLIGHARHGFGFDRQGEYAAWRVQEPLHSPLARLALATELHAEHSVRWTTGTLAEHKATAPRLDLLTRARRGSHPIGRLSVSADCTG